MKEMDSPNYDGKDKASNKVDDVDDDAIFFKSRTQKSLHCLRQTKHARPNISMFSHWLSKDDDADDDDDDDDGDEDEGDAEDHLQHHHHNHRHHRQHHHHRHYCDAAADDVAGDGGDHDHDGEDSVAAVVVATIAFDNVGPLLSSSLASP